MTLRFISIALCVRKNPQFVWWVFYGYLRSYVVTFTLGFCKPVLRALDTSFPGNTFVLVYPLPGRTIMLRLGARN
jgi:hypothetical protein